MRKPAYILLVALAPLVMGAGAYREPRELVFTGTPITVYVAKDRRTEVVFPESLTGMLPPSQQQANSDLDPTAGMEWSLGPTKDRLFLLPTIEPYNGTMTLHGVSGKSYILYLQSSTSPDISAIVHNGKLKQEEQLQEEKRTPRHKLIEFLIRGTTPPGYSRKIYDGPVKNRIVYRQGSIVIYLQELYSSPNYSGFVLTVENTGRAPVYFPVESVDYTSRQVRKAFGRIWEISIDNPYLGPKPDNASDVLAAPHQTLMYIASKKQRDDGR